MHWLAIGETPDNFGVVGSPCHFTGARGETLGPPDVGRFACACQPCSRSWAFMARGRGAITPAGQSNAWDSWPTLQEGLAYLTSQSWGRNLSNPGEEQGCPTSLPELEGGNTWPSWQQVGLPCWLAKARDKTWTLLMKDRVATQADQRQYQDPGPS